MPQSKVLHHVHLRKRIHQKHEKYPHPDKWKRFFDKAVLIVGIITVILTMPQVFKIFIEKTAAGVSLISWTTFTIAAMFWLAYGILHKEKPIIITYIGYFIQNFIIVIGVIIYG